MIPYSEAWDLQLRLVEARGEGRIGRDILLLLEHPPVFTLGKRGGRENLLVPEELLAQSGIPIVQIERGGNITFHGPGQLVLYPIVHLPSLGLGVVDMVDRLEELMIRTCAAWEVAAGRNALNRGAWVGLKKIGSIGIAVRRGVSFHGLALNVNLDLKPFCWIQPCGLEGIGITSIQAEAGRPVAVAEVKQVMRAQVEAVFQTRLEPTPRQSLFALLDPSGPKPPLPRKPDWLKRRLPAGQAFNQVRELIAAGRLHTVCQEAKCPNIWECYSHHTATFLIMGERCTRNCRFCSVAPGVPAPLDPQEPARVAEAAARMELAYVVVTSVTRDDLPDGGAGHFAATLQAIRRRMPPAEVEVLIPDFQGQRAALETVLRARPDVLNHNIETVPRLYARVRPQADYRRSLELLRRAREFDPTIPTKSGLMLGLGERPEEVRQALADLRAAGCRILTLGQYLQPSAGHLPVERFILPQDFDGWRDTALAMGFSEVASAPFVRSSYHAKEAFQRLNRSAPGT
jgi:lipoic acid synthetase